MQRCCQVIAGIAKDLLDASHDFGTLHIVEATIDPATKQIVLAIDGKPEGKRPFKPTEMSFDEITVGARFCNNGTGPQHMFGPFRGDIAELWAMRSTRHDVQVVQHPPYQTKAAQKYLGAPNEDYPRKNWSSVILWNCASYPNRVLTPDYVSRETGAHLHRFAWCDDARIGELDAQWNWMPQEFGERADAKLLHWTLGSPCFLEYANTEMSEFWHAEFERMAQPFRKDEC